MTIDQLQQLRYFITTIEITFDKVDECIALRDMLDLEITKLTRLQAIESNAEKYQFLLELGKCISGIPITEIDQKVTKAMELKL